MDNGKRHEWGITQLAEQRTRLNLTVDEDTPALLEKLAGGRNSMGAYLSRLLRSVEIDEGTAAEIERADHEAIRLMLQGMAGRLRSVEAEVVNLRANLAQLVADRCGCEESEGAGNE